MGRADSGIGTLGSHGSLESLDQTHPASKSAIAFGTYLDNTNIGSKIGKCYFAKTDVEPSTKHLSSWCENSVAIKVVFEGGRIFFPSAECIDGHVEGEGCTGGRERKRLDFGDLAGQNYYEFDQSKNEERDLTDEKLADVSKDADTLALKADGTVELVPSKPK